LRSAFVIWSHAPNFEKELIDDDTKFQMGQVRDLDSDPDYILTRDQARSERE
jgi:hypothetical protein